MRFSQPVRSQKNILNETAESTNCPYISTRPLHFRILPSLLSLIRDMWTKFRCHVMTGEGLTDSLTTSTGVKQSCFLSPEFLHRFLAAVPSITHSPSGALIREVVIDKLTYSNHIVLISEFLRGLLD